MSKWTLFSNHGHVLVCLSRDPEARLRDVAANVGITERAVQKIVRDLQDADMLIVTKTGRRNSYRIHSQTPLRHELEADCTLKDLLKMINKAGRRRNKPAKPAKKTDKPDSSRHKYLAEEVKPVSVHQRVSDQPGVSLNKFENPKPNPKPESAPKPKPNPKPKREGDTKETSKTVTKKDEQQGSLF